MWLKNLVQRYGDLSVPAIPKNWYFRTNYNCSFILLHMQINSKICYKNKHFYKKITIFAT